MTTTRTFDPRRGEVWLVEFDPSIGDEQQKARPAVVVGLDGLGRLRLRIIVPFTTRKALHSEHVWLVPIEATGANGLTNASSADAFQVKSLSIERFVRRLGNLEGGQTDDIAMAIAVCVGLPAA